MAVLLVAALLFNCALPSVEGLDNGLARAPPIGWMSGERFGCQVDCSTYPDDCISERLIRSTADILSLNSFQSVGFQYIVIDDCWMDAKRDSNNRLQADVKRFPSGMINLVSYVHSKNLKIGLYIDLGNVTCGGYPGSAGNFRLDAQTLSGWQVDMVKVGACGIGDYRVCNTAYPEFGRALNSTGRPILYLCEWPYSVSSKGGGQVDFAQVSATCNQFRVFDDITDSWESLTATLNFYVRLSYPFKNYSRPGSFSDPDQLLIGDFGLSVDQQKFQMALWSILSAPLFVSSDLRRIQSESKKILLNRRAIAINQDSLGNLGQEILVNGQVHIWRKAILPTGSFALAIFYLNIFAGPSKVSVRLADIGIRSAAVFNVTESFSDVNYGLYKPWHTLDCEVNPTGALLFEIIAIS